MNRARLACAPVNSSPTTTRPLVLQLVPVVYGPPHVEASTLEKPFEAETGVTYRHRYIFQLPIN
jgi:hypothetical protein